MRLIDADALAAHMFHGYGTEVTPVDIDAETYKLGWNDAIDAIMENAPTIEPEHDGWIPTKIAKPPKAGQYLVTKQQKTGAYQIATAHYNPSFDEWSGNGNFKKILAWQPLPLPYTQE